MLIEAVLTAILTIVIFAVTDSANKTIPQGLAGALIIGMTVAILGSSFGSLTGFAMNPARDFGPRLFAFLAGWGQQALPGNNYFWVPVVGPILGAGLGGLLYEKVLSASLVEKTNQVKLPQEVNPVTKPEYRLKSVNDSM